MLASSIILSLSILQPARPILHHVQQLAEFGKLFEYADSVNAEFVATGHYARVQGSGFRVQEAGAGNQICGGDCSESPGTALLRGRDQDKDQSYVLFGVQRQHLSRMMFPVGGFRKSQIRDLARELVYA